MGQISPSSQLTVKSCPAGSVTDKRATIFRKQYLYSHLDLRRAIFKFSSKINKILFQICEAYPYRQGDIEYLTPIYQILAVPVISRHNSCIDVPYRFFKCRHLFAPSIQVSKIFENTLCPQPLGLVGKIWQVSRGLNTPFRKILGSSNKFRWRYKSQSFSHRPLSKFLR